MKPWEMTEAQANAVAELTREAFEAADKHDAALFAQQLADDLGREDQPSE